MPNPSLTSSSHFSRAARAALFALLLAGTAFFILFAAVPNANAANKRIVLGESSKRLEPNCGKDFSRQCIVEGKVTGYQVFRKGSARKNTFRVPFNGKIVSWSISLSRPTRGDITKDGTTHPGQMPFFDPLFGSPSSARISVLRRVAKNKKGPPKWRMVRQSPIEIMNPYFGRTVHFALERPLNVIRDQIVALTVPTWVPALWKPRACNETPFGVQNESACGVAEDNFAWRASRAKDKCKLGVKDGNPNEALVKSRPQQKVDSERRYGCYYSSTVLLYSATVIGKN